MNIIVCTSRGHAIREQFTNLAGPNIKYSFHIFPGARFSRLITNTRELLSHHFSKVQDTKIVYIIAGLPDVTTKVNDRRANYQEVIFTETPETVRDRVMRDIHRLSDMVHSFNCIVVFSPIVPSNIEKWNKVRLSQSKTVKLLHVQHYSEMQKKLHSTILDLNREIVAINVSNNVSTPFLTSEIITCYKRKRAAGTNQNHNSSYKFSYQCMPDGVHVNIDKEKNGPFGYTNALLSIYLKFRVKILRFQIIL